MPTEFHLPVAFDLFATALFAWSGALLAVRRGYDVAGLAMLALVAGVGGGLLRDGIFLGREPPAAIADPRYVLAVAAAATAGLLFGARVEHRGRTAFLFADALGLAAYAVVGAQQTLAAGLAVPAAVVVGVLNAVGGGVLRDVLAHEEPEVFRPSGFYAVAAFSGAFAYAALARWTSLNGVVAAVLGIAVGFGLRMLSLRYGWRTKSLGRRG